MRKYFVHPYGITVSEFQMMSISLGRGMDYQIALRIVRDELQARKDEKRAWIADRTKVWNYFSMIYKEALTQKKIHNLYDLIKQTFEYYQIEQPTS